MAIDKRFYLNIDLLQNELKNGVIQNLASDPASPKEGQFWFNTATSTINYYGDGEVRTVAQGSDLTDAVTRATDASEAGVLMISGGADKTAASYTDGAGIIKVDANGVVSTATSGTDYLTEDSTNTLTNKTFDAQDVTNTLSNIDTTHFAAGVLKTDLNNPISDEKLATSKAIKNFIEQKISALGTLVGSYDASSGDLPTVGSGAGDPQAIVKGDYWRITVAGDIAGLGHLEIGDALVAAENDADEAADFFILQANITDAVTSDGESAVVGEIPVYKNANGRIIGGGSGVSVDEGHLNIADGKEYRINGENILAKNSRTHAESFDNDTDWTGAEAPYTFTVAAATHELGVTDRLSIEVRDSSGYSVEVYDRVETNGTVTLQANSKFAGTIIISN